MGCVCSGCASCCKPRAFNDDVSHLAIVIPKPLEHLFVSKDSGIYFNLEAGASLDAIAKRCHDSMSGLGTDEAGLIRTLVNCPPVLMDDLESRFSEMFERRLFDMVDNEAEGGLFNRLMLALAQESAQVDANTCYAAMSKVYGTDNQALIRTVSTRDHMHLKKVRKLFEEKGEGTLEAWISADTGFDYKNLLLALQDRAKFVAGELKYAIGDFVTDDEDLITLISGLKRNKFVHEIVEKYEKLDTTGAMRSLLAEIKEECCGVGLEEVKEAYEEMTGGSLMDAVKSSASFDYERLCNACLEHAGDRDARYIKTAMDNDGLYFGTHDTKLLSVLMTRSPCARKEMATCYYKNYGQTIKEAIQEETGGDYETVLVGMITPRSEYVADHLHNAFGMVWDDAMAVCRLLCHCSKETLKNIQTVYAEKYGKTLQEEIQANFGNQPWFRRSLSYILAEAWENSLRVPAYCLDYATDVPSFVSRLVPEEALPWEVAIGVNNFFGMWNGAIYLKGDVMSRLQGASREIAAAIKGIGTDEARLIRELNSMPKQHRAKLRAVFNENIAQGGHTISSWIGGDTSRDFKRICLSLTMTPNESKADTLVYALEGMGTDDSALQRTMVLMSPMDLPTVKKIFQQRHAKGLSLEEAIKQDTCFKYKKTLVALANPAKAIAAELHTAIQKWYGTDDAELIRLVAGLQRNEKAQEIISRYKELDNFGLCRSLLGDLKSELGGATLTEVKAEFLGIAGQSLEKAIEGDTSWNYKRLLLSLVEDQGTRDAKFAYRALTNDGWELGTNDRKLIAMLVLRTRHERAEMAKAYKELYGQSLEDAISGETMGWYRDALVLLLKPIGETLVDFAGRAMDGIGTDEVAMLRMLCAFSKVELREFCQAFEAKYNMKLTDRIRGEVTGILDGGESWFSMALSYIQTHVHTDDLLIDPAQCMVRRDVYCRDEDEDEAAKLLQNS